ncbi:hypothetical protein SAMN05444273_102487 [Litoreibacter ascidiaceicola]|uniref:Uncharacterized protein n=1 Tax=Litoreibacter ascidiaceicola TaxID=1486859 RepID=A0A1M4W4A4_9RHOB|nr:hypothetical protein SAMN05444273_102487 [Litoreibacter ascidiaceicola]
MLQNIACRNAKFSSQTAADLQNMSQTIPTLNGRFIMRNRVGMYMRNATCRFDENEIKRNQRVSHPERQRLRALVNKQHSGELGQRFAVHQTNSPFACVVCDFDTERD